MGTGSQPTGNDNDPNHGAPKDDWYPIYLIGQASGVTPMPVALVAGGPQNQPGARNPFTQGPLLDDSVYPFATNNWIYWKFIAYVRNASGTYWEIVPMRKIGNHCEYELAQRALAHGDIGDTGWVNTTSGLTPVPGPPTLDRRIPPTSMRAFLRAWVTGKNATQEMRVRPPNLIAGVDMHLHDIPLTGLAQEEKIRATAFTITADLAYWGSETGWVATNEFQQVAYRHIANGLDHNGYIDVLGYQEFLDVPCPNHNWP
jgi:hypothetical protein